MTCWLMTGFSCRLFPEFDKYGFHHFPFLQLDDGNYIFSSDAIMKYLLPTEEPVELRDQVSSFYFKQLLRTFQFQYHSI